MDLLDLKLQLLVAEKNKEGIITISPAEKNRAVNKTFKIIIITITILISHCNLNSHLHFADQNKLSKKIIPRQNSNSKLTYSSKY